MLNLLIKSYESITTAILNRFVSFGHNINGSHRPWIDARNYASFSAAIDACGRAGSNPCTLSINNNQALSSNKTILPHVTLWISNGGRITFSGGAILTVQGSVIEEGLQQWIFGTGTVVFDTGFMKTVYPQWWGAKGNGSTEDTTAIQAAITAVSANGLTVKFVAGNYLIDNLDLPYKCKLIGEGIALTKFTRKTGAAGVGLESSGDADDIVLNGFELDCGFEGTDGVKLGFSGGLWGESGLIKDLKVTDSAGIGVHLAVDGSNIYNLTIENADGGAVGTRQIRFTDSVCNVYGLTLKGETGTIANLEFLSSNINIYGMFLSDPHLTKAIRFDGDNNNIIGLNIVTEDNTKTYTQLFYFESGAIENVIRDVHIEKGASDTITNSVQDDENSRTVIFATNFSEYEQTASFFVGDFTRDVSLASGTQAITGVGFKPKAVMFINVINNSGSASWGTSDGVSHGNIQDTQECAPDEYDASAVRCITTIVSCANIYSGLIQSFDEDGFTIDWLKTASPTGTLRVNFLAFR